MRYLDSHCTYTEEMRDGKHVYIFVGPYLDDPKRSRRVVVSGEGLYRLRQGAKIQEAFPEMSADDREFLMTGLSPEAFDRISSDESD